MGRGDKILVGMVVKSKLGELGEELREGFSSRLRKYLTAVVQGVSSKNSFLVRFQDGCGNDLTLN